MTDIPRALLSFNDYYSSDSDDPSAKWFIESTGSRRGTRKLVDFGDRITWIPRRNKVDPRHRRVFEEPFLTGEGSRPAPPRSTSGVNAVTIGLPATGAVYSSVYSTVVL